MCPIWNEKSEQVYIPCPHYAFLNVERIVSIKLKKAFEVFMKNKRVLKGYFAMYCCMMAFFCMMESILMVSIWGKEMKYDNLDVFRREFIQLNVLERYKKSSLMEKIAIKQCYPQKYVDMVECVLKDMNCFPVKNQEDCVVFENSWHESRAYGGMRGHEGVDLMYTKNRRGEIIIQSVCEGVIEQKGWLPLGGYRIGIRGKSGAYYYYAHLFKYNPKLEIGDFVNAGDVLGTMGDSGYGEEGTVGKFPVHLHFGIYVPYKGEDISVNPYSILCFIKNKEEK